VAGKPLQIPLPLYRVLATPCGAFRQHVIGPGGELHQELTLVAEGLGQREPGTATAYLRVIRRFVAWSERVAPGGYPPEEMPKLVAAYLRDALDCRLRLIGENRWYVTPTRHAASTIRVTISALIAFMDVQLEFSLIQLPRNPLRCDGDGRWRGGLGRFVVKGQLWVPNYRHLPDLAVQMRRGAQVDAWPQWARVLLAVLFDSGARIGDAIDLRLADWLVSGCGPVLSAPSKGSAGLRVKHLAVSEDTLVQMHAYFAEERARRSRMSLTQLREAASANRAALMAPIFLSRAGAAPRPDSFRKLWRGTVHRLGLQHSPHSARHWYVTTRVADILAQHESPIRRAQEIALLIEYMHWANGKEMLDVYASPLALRAAQDFARATDRRQLSFSLFDDARTVVYQHRDLRSLVDDPE